MTFDTDKGEIHGTINIPEWDAASEEKNSEEQKYIEAVVHVRNETGEYHEEFIYINVYRDTDNDGIPDNTDTDDDGDGYSDMEEEVYGTYPKSSESVPDPSNHPEGSFATFIEGKEIEPIYVRAPQSPYTKLWVVSLPDGLTYNPETRLITGIIEVGEWKENQKRKYFFMSFAESYTDGGITETQAWGNILEVLRDSDKDGVPDIDETPEDTKPATTVLKLQNQKAQRR